MSRRRHHADPPALTPEFTTFSDWTRHLEAGISSLATTPVSLVMRRDVPCIDEDASEESLVEMLLDRDIHGVAVVDRDKFLVGFVSTTDVVRTHHDEDDSYGEEPLVPSQLGLGGGYHEQPVPRSIKEFMTTVAVDVLETASLAKASLLMARYKVHQLPVVRDDGRVAGLITATNILCWMYEQGASSRRGRRRVSH